ncbi:MAG: Gfo/Idh/MocA family oxidoreductase [Nitrososphaerota archaeon]
MSGKGVMAGRVKLGFIGCGMIAQFHARALTEDLGAEVVALSDVKKESITSLKRAAPQLRDAREYSDYVEMFEKEQLDGVLVLTPHVYHKEQVLEALKRGVHVLVEKPMVTGVNEAREILSAAESTGLVVALAYQRRTDGYFTHIKQLVSGDGLGEPLYIEHQLSQDWAGLSKGTWRADSRLAGGGFLMDSGSHIVDMVLWYAGGLPLEVFATLSSKEGWGAELMASISARFRGCVASVSLMGDAPIWSERLRIYCPGGLVSYLDELGSRRVWVMDREAKRLSAPWKELPKHSSPLANFVRAIVGEEKPAAGPVDGLRVAIFKEACYRSAEKGAPVKLA